MKWMKDRDLLIAQTMAFVQSVTGKKPEAEKTVVSSVTRLSVEISSRSDAPAPMPDIEALLAVGGAVTEPSRPVPMARPGPRDDIQSEIRARIASFRAHQERFNREREAYCSATMAKVHAALRDGELPPRLGK